MNHKVASWRQSSSCSDSGCVAIKFDGDSIRVKDSKNADSAVLTFDPVEWAAFVAGVKRGEFDLPAASSPSA